MSFIIKEELESLKGQLIRICTINENFYDGVLKKINEHTVILERRFKGDFDWTILLKNIDAWTTFSEV